MNRSHKPLVACAANEGPLRNHIEAAAEKMGTDFFSSVHLEQTFEECGRRRSSCVVVDFEITRGQVERFSKSVCKSQVLLMAIPRGDTKAAFQSATAGAIGVVEKPIKGDELILCLETALAGEIRFKKSYQEKERFSSDYFSELSEREKNVLHLLMTGEPNKRVASLLDIGLRTVEADRAHVMKKLHVFSFVELIRLVTDLENDIASARQVFFNEFFSRRKR